MEGSPATVIRCDGAKVPTSWGEGEVLVVYMSHRVCVCVRLCMCVPIRTILVESHPDLANLKHQHSAQPSQLDPTFHLEEGKLGLATGQHCGAVAMTPGGGSVKGLA